MGPVPPSTLPVLGHEGGGAGKYQRVLEMNLVDLLHLPFQGRFKGGW